MKMPTFIMLGKFTQKGTENIKETPKQLEEARKQLKSLGINFKFYFTMGQYDFAAIGEAPNIKAMMKSLFLRGSTGRIKTETLVAIPAEEGLKIIKELP